jgi:hypothetical protein
LPIPPISKQMAANTWPRILILGLMWMMSSHSPSKMMADAPMTSPKLITTVRGISGGISSSM